MPAGPVEVDLDMPAVNQLWPEFCKIVGTTNAVMLPFLTLFGAEEGNGVSPFARTFETPNDLITVINIFFQPPASDPRDRPTEGDDDEQPESDDEDEEASAPASPSAISTTFLEERLEEIIELDDADEEEIKSDKDESSFDNLVELSASVEPFESFFDNGNADAALTMLRHMLSQTSIIDVSMYAYKLTQVCLSFIRTVMKPCAGC